VEGLHSRFFIIRRQVSSYVYSPFLIFRPYSGLKARSGSASLFNNVYILHKGNFIQRHSPTVRSLYKMSHQANKHGGHVAHPATISSHLKTRIDQSSDGTYAHDCNHKSLSPDKRNSPRPASDPSNASSWSAANVLFKVTGMSIVNFVSFGSFKTIDKEERKVVIDQSRKLAATRCFIHILPVAGIVTLISLNTRGYFIGKDLQGSSHTVNDAVDILALQVTSKLMVRTTPCYFEQRTLVNIDE
jgi:hypothetical protein